MLSTRKALRQQSVFHCLPPIMGRTRAIRQFIHQLTVSASSFLSPLAPRSPASPTSPNYAIPAQSTCEQNFRCRTQQRQRPDLLIKSSGEIDARGENREQEREDLLESRQQREKRDVRALLLLLLWRGVFLLDHQSVLPVSSRRQHQLVLLLFAAERGRYSGSGVVMLLVVE